MKLCSTAPWRPLLELHPLVVLFMFSFVLGIDSGFEDKAHIRVLFQNLYLFTIYSSTLTIVFPSDWLINLTLVHLSHFKQGFSFLDQSLFTSVSFSLLNKRNYMRVTIAEYLILAFKGREQRRWSTLSTLKETLDCLHKVYVLKNGCAAQILANMTKLWPRLEVISYFLYIFNSPAGIRHWKQTLINMSALGCKTNLSTRASPLEPCTLAAYGRAADHD